VDALGCDLLATPLYPYVNIKVDDIGVDTATTARQARATLPMAKRCRSAGAVLFIHVLVGRFVAVWPGSGNPASHWRQAGWVWMGLIRLGGWGWADVAAPVAIVVPLVRLAARDESCRQLPEVPSGRIAACEHPPSRTRASKAAVSQANARSRAARVLLAFGPCLVLHLHLPRRRWSRTRSTHQPAPPFSPIIHEGDREHDHHFPWSNQRGRPAKLGRAPSVAGRRPDLTIHPAILPPPGCPAAFVALHRGRDAG